MNQHKLAFLSVMENARHIMGFGAPDKNIDAQKDSRWSCRSVLPLYKPIWVDGLKCGGNGVAIISWG